MSPHHNTNKVIIKYYKVNGQGDFFNPSHYEDVI